MTISISANKEFAKSLHEEEKETMQTLYSDSRHPDLHTLQERPYWVKTNTLNSRYETTYNKTHLLDFIAISHQHTKQTPISCKYKDLNKKE